jgi:hypothetical protein
LQVALSLLAASSISFSQTATAPNAADYAQHQIKAYLAKLADLHCTESVTQEKLSGNGHIEASEHAKYDFLIMIDGSGDDFQLNESRIESAASRHKQLPMLVTNGFSTALLVFHPYYRDSFIFETGAAETVAGKDAVPIHFTHIQGHRTPVALALRGREFPLDLEGTAWLDKQSGEVLKMDAALLHDMSDIGLKSLSIHVEYKPTMLDKNAAPMALPSLAVIDVSTPLQHWRNIHSFDEYKRFSSDAEPDSNVKIRAANTSMGPESASASLSSDLKEKP